MRRVFLSDPGDIFELFEFSDGDGDRIAVRRGPGRGSKVELSPSEGAAFAQQDTLHWNPRTKFLHDDSGRIPLEDELREPFWTSLHRAAANGHLDSARVWGHPHIVCILCASCVHVDTRCV